MKSPVQIPFSPRSAVLALLLALAPTLAVAQSDDFSHGDSLWTRQDPIYELSNLYGLGLGPQVTFSFPAGGGYRIQTLVSPDAADLGPGRGGAIRQDVNYSDSFSVAADLLAWDNTTEQIDTVMGRISTPGAGTTSGYFLGYNTPGSYGNFPGQGVLGIYRVDNEAATSLVLSTITLNPTNTYRLTFFGQGSDLEGRLYLLPNTNTPLLALSANDPTYASGYCGLIQADASDAMDAPSDVTYGYYSATNFCICDQPQNVVCFAGATVTLTTSAIGTLPLSYQWTHAGTNLLDGAAVSGSTTASLSLNSVTTNNAGAYAVIVKDASGRRATSAAATVSLLNLTHGSPEISITSITFSNLSVGIIPPGMTIYDDAYADASGELHLTDAVNSEDGSFVVSDLDHGAMVQSFDAQFEALIGGSSSPISADGMSFSWATDLTGPFGESGSPTGLTVIFEVYNNNSTIPGPGVSVKYGGVSVAQQRLPLSFLETYPNFVPVDVRLSPGGLLTVAYNSVVLFDHLPIPGLTGVAGASFGWGARTGADNDNFWISNVSLTTNPQILNFSPTSRPAGISFSFYGVLQYATKVSGPYTDLPQAASPFTFTFPAGGGQMFWRARAP